MTHRSPLVTLVGLVAAFAIMFGVNLASSAARDSYGQCRPERRRQPLRRPSPTPDPARHPVQRAADPAARRRAPPRTRRAVPEQGRVRGPYATTTRSPIAVADPGQQGRGVPVRRRERGVLAARHGRRRRDLADQQERRHRLEAKLDARRTGGQDRGGRTTKLDFTIAEAKTPAGLYRARGAKTTIGWIVLPDGSQVGIQTTGEESSPGPGARPRQPRGDRRRRAAAGRAGQRRPGRVRGDLIMTDRPCRPAPHHAAPETATTRIGPVLVAFAIGTAVGRRPRASTAGCTTRPGRRSTSPASPAASPPRRSWPPWPWCSPWSRRSPRWRMFGRIPLTGAWVGPVHRWSGRIAVAVTVPVAVHCLYALGFQTFDARVIIHSIFGCFFYGAFVVQDVDLDPGRLAEVGAAAAGRPGAERPDRTVDDRGAVVLPQLLTSRPLCPRPTEHL